MSVKPDSGRPEDILPENGDGVIGEEEEVKEVEEEGREEDLPGEEGKEESESDESLTVEMLTDLAETLGVEPSILYSLKIKPDNGDPITIGELKDAVQAYGRREKEFEQRSAEIEQEKQALAGRLQQIQQFDEQLTQKGQDALMAMQVAEADYKRINWDELERIDPARAVLEKQKLYQRHAEASQRLEEAKQEAAQINQAKMAEFKNYHDRILLERIPEWKDPNKAREEVTKIVDWVTNTYGFSQQEIASTLDWRHREILRKACMYDELMTRKAEMQSDSPKVVIKRGINLPKEKSNDSALNRQIAAAKKSRNPSDKIAAARAILDRSFATKQRAKR